MSELDPTAAERRQALTAQADAVAQAVKKLTLQVDAFRRELDGYKAVYAGIQAELAGLADPTPPTA